MTSSSTDLENIEEVVIDYTSFYILFSNIEQFNEYSNQFNTALGYPKTETNYAGKSVLVERFASSIDNRYNDLIAINLSMYIYPTIVGMFGDKQDLQDINDLSQLPQRCSLEQLEQLGFFDYE